ncbi:hypothetical protein SAMN02746065_13136 [Desulfocicer vacuolatum DSM 3385]|uniref:Damage-control phosphatase ARMT1-like metal-binding domain-containing protein n=1 Tax=Desulfocicer vacuolatum DSM 3385 TaxID=1121400 RepID=A0A1W2EH21_9BACT|nr:ARMT1-like domain-containing protein [Desulfocicer vacuolatum]SMD08987.1 hypothetical protein SAMN02746065_13136 [Desulfocicer vacuolatum DSM 3385]
MKIYNDCIPCLVRQSLDAARLAGDDEQMHQRVLKETLTSLTQIDLDQSPPMMAAHTQETIRRVTGDADPYNAIKKQYNGFALELYPELKKKVQASATALETALRLSIAGNIIDFGALSTLDNDKVLKTLDHALTQDVHGDLGALINAMGKARSILWLADNAGEIVCDRLVLELLDKSRVIFAVRGAPVINDATREDARVAGICDMVTVIDNGTAIPGTELKQCSKEFINAYENADLIISKGQGNYETLPHDDHRIYFLFKAKCPVVAREAGCVVGDIVVQNKENI